MHRHTFLYLNSKISLMLTFRHVTCYMLHAHTLTHTHTHDRSCISMCIVIAPGGQQMNVIRAIKSAKV